MAVKTGFSVGLMRAFAAGQWAMDAEQIGHLVTEAADEIERLRAALKQISQRTPLPHQSYSRIEFYENIASKALGES